MAVDVAAPPLPRARARARVLAYPVQAALGGLVALSFVLRALLAQLHITPYYLPDEYLYPTLARSIATSGRPLVRGADAHFPALLQPILTAPFQLFDPGTAFTLTQVFGALVMSLAAIPAYLLARRIGIAHWPAFACGVLAVAVPDVVYSGFMLADPIAYPLALTALYAGVRALDDPSRRTQLAFLVWTGLATFGRLQYVVLLPAFALAALALHRLRALSRYRFSLLVVGIPAVAAVALGPSRFVGVYSGGTHVHVSLGAALGWAGRDAVLLAYAAGWVLVPGALAGLTAVRTRAEKAFALLAGFLALGLLLESGWIAAIDSKRFQERYLMSLLPLVGIAFALWVKRGAPRRYLVVAVSLALLLFSMRVPLSGYAAAHGKDDSPVLHGVLRLEQAIGTGEGSLVVALVAAVLSAVAVVLAWKPRRAVLVGMALAVAASAGLSTGAYGFDHRNSVLLREHVLPADARWIDHAGVANVGVLMLPNSEPDRTLTQMIWNRSITDVLLLGPEKIDGYKQTDVGVADDGRILVPGGTFVGPLAVQTYGSRAAFADARRIAKGNEFELWQPDPGHAPRLALLAGGLYSDGWLAWRSFVSVWPDASGRVEGTLHLSVGMPKHTAVTKFTLSAPGYIRTIRLVPGVRQSVAIPVSHRGPWTVKFSTPSASYVGGLRAVSARMLSPVFTRASGTTISCTVPPRSIPA